MSMLVARHRPLLKVLPMVGWGLAATALFIASNNSNSKNADSDREENRKIITECMTGDINPDLLPDEYKMRAQISSAGINVYPPEGDMNKATLVAIFRRDLQLVIYKNPEHQPQAEQLAACARSYGAPHTTTRHSSYLAPV